MSSMRYCVLVFFSLFIIAITSLGEARANVSAFRTFVRFALVWFCLFPLPLGVWEGLRFVIVALPGLFSYPFVKETTAFGLKFVRTFRTFTVFYIQYLDHPTNKTIFR